MAQRKFTSAAKRSNFTFVADAVALLRGADESSIKAVSVGLRLTCG
jgi:hypothetical protein